MLGLIVPILTHERVTEGDLVACPGRVRAARTLGPDHRRISLEGAILHLLQLMFADGTDITHPLAGRPRSNSNLDEVVADRQATDPPIAGAPVGIVLLENAADLVPQLALAVCHGVALERCLDRLEQPIVAGDSVAHKGP